MARTKKKAPEPRSLPIISFAWTTGALLALRKRCTRRRWNDAYARRFKTGMEVQAYDRSPRIGGIPLAVIRLTCDPYLELTGQMPETDYEAEGLAWIEEKGLLIRGKHPWQFWREWKAANEEVYVVRFQEVKVLTVSPSRN